MSTYIYIYIHITYIKKQQQQKHHTASHKPSPHCSYHAGSTPCRAWLPRLGCEVVLLPIALMCYMMLHVYVVCLQCIHGIHELFSMYAMYHIYQIVMDDLGAWVRLFGGIATAVSADIFWQKR